MKGYKGFGKPIELHDPAHKDKVELTPAEAAWLYNGPVQTYRAVWNPKTGKYEPGEKISKS